MYTLRFEMSLLAAHRLLEVDNGFLFLVCSMPPSLFAHILCLAGETEAARLNRCLASYGVDHYMSATCEVNYEQLQSPPVWGDLNLSIVVIELL